MTTLTVGGCWTHERLLTTSAERSPLAELRPASGVIAVDVILSHPSAQKLVNAPPRVATPTRPIPSRPSRSDLGSRRPAAGLARRHLRHHTDSHLN
jgi:hypothetical protein